MGLKHVRAVSAHPQAKLVAAIEPDPERAKVDVGCPIFADAVALIGKVDKAIVAVPTAVHAKVAEPLLAAGIDCLIEKPFVANEAEARRLHDAARAGKTIVRVGHIERFNPAITALLANPPRDIRALAARRISGASARVTDIDVILDLMVHDLDAVLAIKRQPVIAVSAVGNRDHATALLTFTDATTATVTASRVTPLRLRDLDVLCADRALHVDYIARTLTEHRVTAVGFDATPLPVAPHDALEAQLSAFLAARDGRSGVTAEEALDVMTVAWRIQAALNL
jgi:predicted dehydrogenase